MVHEATVTVANSAVSTYKYLNKEQNHNYPTPADKNSATNFTTQWISRTSHGAGMFHASINTPGGRLFTGRHILMTPASHHSMAFHGRAVKTGPAVLSTTALHGADRWNTDTLDKLYTDRQVFTSWLTPWRWVTITLCYLTLVSSRYFLKSILS